MHDLSTCSDAESLVRMREFRITGECVTCLKHVRAILEPKRLEIPNSASLLPWLLRLLSPLYPSLSEQPQRDAHHWHPHLHPQHRVEVTIWKGNPWMLWRKGGGQQSRRWSAVTAFIAPLVGTGA